MVENTDNSRYFKLIEKKLENIERKLDDMGKIIYSNHTITSGQEKKIAGLEGKVWAGIISLTSILIGIVAWFVSNKVMK